MTTSTVNRTPAIQLVDSGGFGVRITAPAFTSPPVTTDDSPEFLPILNAQSPHTFSNYFGIRKWQSSPKLSVEEYSSRSNKWLWSSITWKRPHYNSKNIESMVYLVQATIGNTAEFLEIEEYEENEAINMQRAVALKHSPVNGRCSYKEITNITEIKDPAYDRGNERKRLVVPDIREEEYVMSSIWGEHYPKLYHFPRPDFTYVSEIADFECEPPEEIPVNESKR